MRYGAPGGVSGEQEGDPEMRKRADGFTLVELMVIVLVIGILVAVAVPVFSAVKTRAETNTCHANQRTWAGVVEQIKAAGEEPGAASAGYAKLAMDESVWYAKATGYLKKIPICPTSGESPVYWVYQTPVGGSSNGSLAGCQQDAGIANTWIAGHQLYATTGGAHRFWRIKAVGSLWSTATTTQEIAEISFFEGASITGTNLCRLPGVTVLGSSERDASCPATCANDGLNGWPGWATKTTDYDRWWRIDLGQDNASEVHSIRLVAWWQHLVARSYSLQWSDTGTADDWHTQASALQTENGTANAKVYEFKNL